MAGSSQTLLVLVLALAQPSVSARKVSWWWDGRPSRAPNASALLSFVSAHRDIVSSVMLNCGVQVQDNGTISGAVSSACVTAIKGLRSINVGAELWLGEQDSIDAARRLFAQPQRAQASLTQVIKKFGLSGINFDLEPAKSNASDAAAYAAFFRTIRPALNAAGARITVDAALWTTMLAQMGEYSNEVDRVLYMHTYYAGSLEEWLEFLQPVLDEEAVARDKLGAGLAIFHDTRTVGWADTAEAAKERLCWLENQSVPEVAMFRIDRSPSRRWPDEFWIAPLQAYVSGQACAPGPAPTGGCPPEWTGPDSSGCCTLHSSPSCGKSCAQATCEHGWKPGWWWKPEDYRHHPYTCCPPNITTHVSP
jgi:hypothetical protein